MNLYVYQTKDHEFSNEFVYDLDFLFLIAYITLQGVGEAAFSSMKRKMMHSLFYYYPSPTQTDKKKKKKKLELSYNPSDEAENVNKW